NYCISFPVHPVLCPNVASPPLSSKCPQTQSRHPLHCHPKCSTSLINALLFAPEEVLPISNAISAFLAKCSLIQSRHPLHCHPDVHKLNQGIPSIVILLMT
ncbi:unnamed protein product, partial [Staurois parvus]